MTSCILLAAGLSTRFGSPKALASLGPDIVIDHVQKMLLSSAIDEIIIVLGAHAEAIKPCLLNHSRIQFVYNKDYNLGQISSCQVGIRAISPRAQWFFVLPVDYPFVAAETISAMVDYATAHHPAIMVPVYHGKKGHPPLFARSFSDEVIGLPHTVGINTVIHAHASTVVMWETDDAGVVQTFNTPAELQQIVLPAG